MAGAIRPIIVPAVRELPTFIILNNLRVVGISHHEYLSILEQLSL